MVALAVLNGALRELTYGRLLPEPRANQLSVLTALVIFWMYAWVLGGWRPLPSSRSALAVGAVWASLTVAFEVLLGRWVAHRSWEALLHEYDLFSG